MQWKPNVVVAAIIRRDNQYLLIEEHGNDGRLVFNQPAGHLEEGETLIEAVKREVLEETAWQFEPEGLVGVYLRPDPANDITYLRFCFYGHCTVHHPDRTLDEGIERTLWMNQTDIEAVADRMRSPLVIKCMQDYLAGHTYPLDMLHRITDLP